MNNSSSNLIQARNLAFEINYRTRHEVDQNLIKYSKEITSRQHVQ